MQNDEKRIAVFIDFENVAMGVRESKYGNFDIDLVLKRLVEKGKIMVKRAYSDWHRYAEFKRAFHQAAIELIDVPQTRYSGKNSADIRMVVDALDLSYQKDHIDTFVLVSGDSDFSPLVSKLRENGRYVIGMGVKQSSSDLLINNCDEFIFYEDLVRPSTAVAVVDPEMHHLSPKKAEAIRLVLETFQALQREGKEVIYGSMIKQTLIRKLPSFNETYYGYPMFSRLLEDAAENKLLKLFKDQKSGGYIVTPPNESSDASSSSGEGTPENGQRSEVVANVTTSGSAVSSPVPAEPRDRFRRSRWERGRPPRGPGRSGEGSSGVRLLPLPAAALSQSEVVPALAGPAQTNIGPLEPDSSPGLPIGAETEIAPSDLAAQSVEPGTATTVTTPPVLQEGGVTSPESNRKDPRYRGVRRPQHFRNPKVVPLGRATSSSPAAVTSLSEGANAQVEPEPLSLPDSVPAKDSGERDLRNLESRTQVTAAVPPVETSPTQPVSKVSASAGRKRGSSSRAGSTRGRGRRVTPKSEKAE